jgi:hypothetical protein
MALTTLLVRLATVTFVLYKLKKGTPCISIRNVETRICFVVWSGYLAHAGGVISLTDSLLLTNFREKSSLSS